MAGSSGTSAAAEMPALRRLRLAADHCGSATQYVCVLRLPVPLPCACCCCRWIDHRCPWESYRAWAARLAGTRVPQSPSQAAAEAPSPVLDAGRRKGLCHGTSADVGERFARKRTLQDVSGGTPGSKRANAALQSVEWQAKIGDRHSGSCDERLSCLFEQVCRRCDLSSTLL